MVLHESRAGDDIVVVGIVAAIVGVYTELLGGSEIVGAAKHIEVFVWGGKTETSLIGYLEPAARALAGGDHDDARGAARAVLGSLCGVLEHSETLYIARVYGGEGGYVGGNAIYDDKWVVAAHHGGGATHTHTVEHGHAVYTVCGDAHAGGFAVEHVEGILGDASGLFSNGDVVHMDLPQGVGKRLRLVPLLGENRCRLQREDTEQR